MSPDPNEGLNGAPANFSLDSDILPRSPRKAKRPKADRGLPSDEELFKLAKMYLDTQRKLWPQLAATDQLPKPSERILTMMAEDFKARHRTGKVDRAAAAAIMPFCQKLGGNYNRYSCDNSDPKSIADQMFNALQKAHEEKRFIPWFYVFCDYSVSGLDSSRRGYQSYKLLLQDEEHAIETTYVDDFTRASRDEIEWWQLAAQSKRLMKRLVGASDNFRLDDPDWDLKLTVYALVSRLFIKSLRQKVRRGMIGTARRRGTVGKPPIGFTRRLKRDESGAVERGPDGIPKTELCFDLKSEKIVLEIFEQFCMKRLTLFEITKEFNRRMVDDFDGWTTAVIRKILINPAYIGVFVWNKTRREFDWEDQTWKVMQNPQKEWVIYYEPKLRMVPVEWWKKARKELIPRGTGGSRPRNKHNKKESSKPIRRSAKSLFSDTVICAYCKTALRLYRSAGKFKDLYCPNGPTGKRQCKLSTSKSLRVVEECLLKFISDSLFTESALSHLLTKANEFLAEETARPQEDLRPKLVRERQLQASIQKLVHRVESEDDESLADGYHARIKELQKQLNELRKEIRESQNRNAPPPPPLEKSRLTTYLTDLRAVLGMEISASAEYLRQLTGPIAIDQELVPGRKRGAKWTASFTPNLMSLLARMGQERNYPDRASLEYLSARIWINTEIAKIPLSPTFKYERLANDPEFIRHLRSGKNPHVISRLMQRAYELVVNAVKFVKTGERPQTKLPGAKARPKGTPPREVLYLKWAAEVGRLKDVELQSFPKIAKRLGITEDTAARAYFHYRRKHQAAAIEAGKPPTRTRYSHIGPDKIAQVKRLGAAGKGMKEIAKAVGVSLSTVHRVIKAR